MTDRGASVSVVLSAEAMAYLQSRRGPSWFSDPQEAALLVIRDRSVNLLLERPTAIWRAVPASGKRLELTLDGDLDFYIGSVAENLGQTKNVILQNLIEGGPYDSEPANKTGLLRTEPRRGRIYGFYFEMPGYQYSFLRALGEDELSGRDVLDEAIVALAEKVVLEGHVRGVHSSKHAIGFAEQLVAGRGLMAPAASPNANRAARPTKARKVAGATRNKME